MSFRAFSIGFSAALLALACGSDDNNNDPDDPEITPPVVPSGNNQCDTNPLAEDCEDEGELIEEDDPPPGQGNDPPETSQQELELAIIQDILADNCGGCHGPALTEQQAQAGMNYITDLERLAEEDKLIPLNADDSLIIQKMRDGEMPPGSAEKVSASDINRIADYINNPDYWEGQGPISDCLDSGQQISTDDLFEIIDQDLSGEDDDDQVNFRYLTLTNRYNAGICADTSLDRDRQSLVKMMNMLSRSASIEEPFDVTGEGLVYRIDLRDYEWDNLAIDVNGEAFNDPWEAIAANNPYAIAYVGDTADDVVADSGTAFPFMYADTVNDVATIGNLYYAIIGVDVNQTLDDFVLNVLGIDQAQNLLDEELFRAGTSDSRLSRQDMVAERHDIEVRNGAYWQRFDFDDQNNDSIFQDPFNFAEDGREAIFTTENGMFGYIIADADGNILEDSDILLDFNQNNFRVVTAQSCSGCHYAGLITFEDQVREFTLDNAVALDLDNDEVEAIEEVYPSTQEFAALIADDSENFYQRALRSASLPVTGADPVSRVFQRFDLDLELNDLAGDLGITPEDLEGDLRELAEQVQVVETGSIDRDDWTQFYLNSVCILSVADENAPDDAVCDQAQLDVDNLGI